MPTRKKSEKLSDYISRCVSVVMRENPSLTKDQALGKCYGMGTTYWKPKGNKKNG